MKTSIKVIAAVIASTLTFSASAYEQIHQIFDSVRQAASEPQGINITAIKDIAARRAGITLNDVQALTFGQLAKTYTVSSYDLDNTVEVKIGYSGEPAPTALTPLTAPVPATTTPTQPAVSSQTVNKIKNTSMTDSIQAGQQAAAAARAAQEGPQLTAANQQRTAQQITALNGAQLTAANQSRTAQQTSALQGAQLTAANQARTAQQTAALQGAQLTAANRARTALQTAALQGAQLTAANRARTQMQVNALLGAQLTQMNIDRVKTQVVGRPTFTETVPAVVLNKPVVKNSAPFQTAKGTGGSSNGQGSQHAGGSGHGENNAGSHAFGGHGYGANNTGSEGFGGGSQFH